MFLGIKEILGIFGGNTETQTPNGSLKYEVVYGSLRRCTKSDALLRKLKQFIKIKTERHHVEPTSTPLRSTVKNFHSPISICASTS